jgi:hypothetical protein
MSVSWKGSIMRRLLVVAIAMLFGSAAQADTTHWTAVHPGQNNSDLRAASLSCGGDPVGVPTTAAYKRCMRSQGWIYTNTTGDNEWVNHYGRLCRPILNGAARNATASGEVWKLPINAMLTMRGYDSLTADPCGQTERADVPLS